MIYFWIEGKENIIYIYIEGTLLRVEVSITVTIRVLNKISLSVTLKPGTIILTSTNGLGYIDTKRKR